MDPGGIQLLVRESGGSVRDALSLSDQVISFVGDKTISESQVAEVLGVADRALTRRLVTAIASGEATCCRNCRKESGFSERSGSSKK